MSRERTDTTRRAVFRLPSPTSAIFDFSKSIAIRITIPTNSKWEVPLHWHRRSPACESVTSVKGPLHVYTFSESDGSGDHLGSTGMSVEFKPGQWVAWSRRDDGRDKCMPLIANLVADQTLYRNICSAILDRTLFPYLATTPYWLKALFKIIEWQPTIRQRLLEAMVWIQLESICYAHDFHLDHGTVAFTWFWLIQPWPDNPPRWVWELEWKSTRLISWLVMTTCYWVGRLLLGMQGEYPQYTPDAKVEK